MESYKEVVFTPRLIAFNETFAPLKKRETSLPVTAVIWHEAISGRKGNDILSSVILFLKQHIFKKKIIIWADNCAAQNKNWILFMYLILYINR